jgi:hypothetical protein
VGADRVRVRVNSKSNVARVVGKFAVGNSAPLCLTVPDREVGMPCTSMAGLCGSNQVCSLHVVTTPFRQAGRARGARRVCDVDAKVMIGALKNSFLGV